MMKATIGEMTATKTRRGRPLDQTIRAIILEANKQRGTAWLESQIHEITPDRTRDACAAILNTVIRDPGHQFSNTSASALNRLADRCTAPVAQTNLPAPATPSPSPTGNGAMAAPASAAAGATELIAALTAVLAPFLPKAEPTQAPQLPPHPPQQVAPAARPREQQQATRKVRDFAGMSPDMQTEVLNAMHRGYAESLVRQNGITFNRALAIVWNKSYAAYEHETGVMVRDMADERDSEDLRVYPQDIIADNGDLVRFHGIVCKTWGVGG